MQDITIPASRILNEELLGSNGKTPPVQVPVQGPRLHPCVCGCGLHAHAGKLNSGGCRSCRCGRYRVNNAWELAYRVLDAMNTGVLASVREYNRRQREQYLAENPRLPGEWSLGPSDAGGCPRSIWYRNIPPANLVRAFSPDSEALMGDMFHEDAVRRLRSLYPWQEFEQWIQVKGLDRRGRLDRWDAVIGIVEDFKTHGDYIANVVDDSGPPIDDWKQVSLYALSKEEEGHTVRLIRITYIERKNGRERGPFERPYDREFAEAARQELLTIAGHLDLVAAENEALRLSSDDPESWIDPDDLGVLPRGRKGPSEDEICRRCPFRRHCWNLDEAEHHGRSGESWTELGANPEATDEKTIWALTNARESADLSNLTEKQKKEAEALIQGLEPGRYGLLGEFTVSQQNHGGRPQYKEYAEALAANAALPADEQVDPESIQVPRGDDSLKTHVKRTAKATLEKEAKLRGEQITLPKPDTGGAA